MKNGIIMQVWKVFNRAKYWEIFQVFFYRRLSTSPKAFEKKMMQVRKFTNILTYLKLFGLAIYMQSFHRTKSIFLLKKKNKIMQGRKVSKRAKYWKLFWLFYKKNTRKIFQHFSLFGQFFFVFHQKHVRRL